MSNESVKNDVFATVEETVEKQVKTVEIIPKLSNICYKLTARIY